MNRNVKVSSKNYLFCSFSRIVHGYLPSSLLFYAYLSLILYSLFQLYSYWASPAPYSMVPFIWGTVLRVAHYGVNVTSIDHSWQKKKNTTCSINTHDEQKLVKIKSNRPPDAQQQRKPISQSKDNKHSSEVIKCIKYSKNININSKRPIYEDKKETIRQEKKETMSNNKKERFSEHKKETLLEYKKKTSNASRLPELWRCRECHQTTNSKYDECKVCGTERPDTPEDLCQWSKIPCSKLSIWLPRDEKGGSRFSAYCATHTNCDVTQLYSIDDLPLRFLEIGDRDKAFESWIETSEWRKRNKFDVLFSRPHPDFDAIKKNMGVFFHGHDRENNPLYIEIPSMHNVKELKKQGYTVWDVFHHYIFTTEYLWQVIEPDDNGQCFIIIDLHGIYLSQFDDDVRQVVKGISMILCKHYPGRTKKIIAINAPWIVSIIWSFMKGFLHPDTIAKVDIYSEDSYKEKLLEYIDPQELPSIYGGSCNCLNPLGNKTNCLLYSELETKMRNFCHHMNETSQEEFREVTLE